MPKPLPNTMPMPISKPQPMPKPDIHPSQRFAAVDALRGLAMVWMTVFHFCFDLQHFGYLHADFYTDRFWTWQRVGIVSLFVFCAGLGQAIAVQQGQTWGRFWRRWRLIALSAVLVSLGSWWMFPQSYIYFGILHGMAVMLILARLLAGMGGMGGWLWGLGALALLLPWLALPLHSVWPGAALLDSRAFNWLGLISHKPVTEDYAPLFPWLGVMCWGLASGQWLLRRHPAWLERLGRAAAVSSLGLPWRGLETMGRWSLSYYMLHQPVLMGALGALAFLR